MLLLGIELMTISIITSIFPKSMDKVASFHVSLCYLDSVTEVKSFRVQGEMCYLYQCPIFRKIHCFITLRFNFGEYVFYYLHASRHFLQCFSKGDVDMQLLEYFQKLVKSFFVFWFLYSLRIRNHYNKLSHFIFYDFFTFNIFHFLSVYEITYPRLLFFLMVLLRQNIDFSLKSNEQYYVQLNY